MTHVTSIGFDFNDLRPRRANQRQNIAGFVWPDFDGSQGRLQMPEEPLPIAGRYLHACMRRFHIAPGVIHRSSRHMGDKIDQQLPFSCDPIITPMGPEPA